MGPATASSSKGLWGGFAKQPGGRRGLGVEGCWCNYSAWKGIISAPAFRFLSCIIATGSHALLQWHWCRWERGQRRRERGSHWPKAAKSEHRCSNMQLWLNDSLYCKLVFSGTLQSGYKINPRDHEIINGTVPEQIMFTCTLFFKG